MPTASAGSDNSGERRPIRAGILGSDLASQALIRELTWVPGLSLVGMVDPDPWVAGLEVAGQEGIPFYSRPAELIDRQAPDWLFNLAHRSFVHRHLAERPLEGVLVIDESTAEIGRRMLATLRSYGYAAAADEMAGELVLALLRSVIRGGKTALEPVFDGVLRDPLTGLYSRQVMLDLLERRAVPVADSEDRMGVLVVDIDEFKSVNDAYGHAAGDRLLQHVAEALTGLVRGSDLVARLGGEEFGIAVTCTSDHHVAQLGERVRAAFRERIQRPDGRPLTVSVGGAVEPAALGSSKEEPSAERVLEAADRAMYRAKENGGDGVHFAEVGTGG